MGFSQWQWYYNKTQHKNTQSHKILHHAQTKHSTQSCTDNKGNITHDECNIKKVKLWPWRPIWSWDVEDPTLFTQSDHRWRLGFYPYVPAALYSPETLFFCFRYLFLLETELTAGPSAAGRIMQIGKENSANLPGMEPATVWFEA
jgi:hypothetical protein